MSKTYLHLIRHGITEGNQKNWIYGGIDIPLAPEGEAALAALRDQGIYPNYDDTEYWTSGMRRTEQTLSILFGPRPHRRIPAMKEISFGIYACSPEESSFTAVFTDMKITECAWKAHDGQQPDEE